MQVLVQAQKLHACGSAASGAFELLDCWGGGRTVCTSRELARPRAAHIYTCIYIYIYIYTYIYIYIPISLSLSLYIYIYICVYPRRKGGGGTERQRDGGQHLLNYRSKAP